MDSLDDIYLNTEEHMEKSLDFLREQFSGIRAGKASPALVENIKVPYYGTLTRLKEMASIATPEPRLITINAYDPTSLGDIEKAILAANIGVTPMNDGRVIRIPIPELSEERRNEMSKVARTMAEDGRIAVRNARREANDTIRKIQKDGAISEDERDHGLKQIQKMTDENIAAIDQLLEQKEKSLMTV